MRFPDRRAEVSRGHSRGGQSACSIETLVRKERNSPESQGRKRRIEGLNVCKDQYAARLMSDKRQKNQLELAFPTESRGEASRTVRAGTESLAAKCIAERPASRLMEEVCKRENLKKALQRVKANKGSAGIDGMSVDALRDRKSVV